VYIKQKGRMAMGKRKYGTTISQGKLQWIYPHIETSAVWYVHCWSPDQPNDSGSFRPC